MIYKIKPMIINSNNIHDLYKELLDEKYKIKMFDKNKDKEIYSYFLPVVRDYVFWTFNLKEDKNFKEMNNEMKSAICNNYSCTIFEKRDSKIVCFSTGVIFILNDENKKINSKYIKDIEKVNIPNDKIYELSSEDEKELYNYIINLYKFITLRKLEKDIDNKDLFNKNRKAFVKFVEEIYTKEITENADGIKLQRKWEKELELDKLYISVENKFDLLYRNSRLDNKDNITRIIIILLVVSIIIGIINLGNWIY